MADPKWTVTTGRMTLNKDGFEDGGKRPHFNVLMATVMRVSFASICASAVICFTIAEAQDSTTPASREFERLFRSFDGSNDVQSLEQLIDHVRFDNSGQTPPAIWQRTDQFVKILASVEKKIDPDFDPDDRASTTVSVGGPYPSGLAPDPIKEPELREAYEAAVRANNLKRVNNRLQFKLRESRERLYREIKSLVSLSEGSPDALRQLTNSLSHHKLNTNSQLRVLKSVKPAK